MKYIYFILIIISITSCTKINEGVINSESAPYQFHSIPIFNLNIPNTNQTFYTFPHQSLKIDYLYQTVLYNDSSSNFKFFSTFILGFPPIKQDQTNFKINEYKNAKSIFQLDVLDDFNSNGFLDEVFQIEYEDSTIIQVRDHFLSLNPQSKNDSVTDVLFQKKFKFSKEDNHKFKFLFYWKPDSNKKYLVFHKDNRIVYNKYKDLDSLILLEPTSGNVISIATEVSVSLLLNGYKNKITQNEVFLFSGTPMNGHNWGKFKDYNNYLFKLKFIENDSIKFDYIDKLKDYSNNDALITIFEDSLKIYAIKSRINKNSEQKYEIQVYSKESNSLITRNDLNWLDGIFFQFEKRDNIFKFYFEKEIIYFNAITYEINKKKLDFNFKIDFDYGGIHSSNLYLPKDLRLKVDVNNNGSNDLFITTNNNQLICVDGSTDEIIAASKKYNHPINWSIGRAQNGNFIVFIYYKDKSETFNLKPNTIFTRINSNLNNFLLVVLFVVIPISLYIIYKLYLVTAFLYSFTQKNEYIGLAIIRKEFFKNKFKITKFNPLFNEIIFFNKSYIPNFDDLPDDIQQIIMNDFKNNNGGTYKYTITNKEIKSITFNTFILKPFLSKSYCILSIQDETQLLKSQITDWIISFVHQSTNELGMIHNRLSSLLYKLSKNFNLDEKLLEQKDIIHKGILNLTKKMRNMLKNSNTEIVTEKMNLALLIEEWFNNNINNYQTDYIKLKIELEDVGEIYINKDHLVNLLDCAVTNSIQAKINDIDLYIVVKLFKIENYIYLEIEDNGIGMSNEFLQSLINWSSITKNNGNGLGLKFIKKACQLHNAELKIFSELNKGTTLKIRFKYE